MEKKKILKVISDPKQTDLLQRHIKLNSMLLEEIKLEPKIKNEIFVLENLLLDSLNCFLDVRNGGTPTIKILEIMEREIKAQNHLVELMTKKKMPKEDIHSVADMTMAIVELYNTFKRLQKQGTPKIPIPTIFMEAIKKTYEGTLHLLMTEEEYLRYAANKELIRQTMRESMGADPSKAILFEGGGLIEKDMTDGRTIH